ncbi:MAG: FMN reductase (NAD(P)H) [Firmicutes bacterium ADurb.Bin419]|nr:MAG: FMN reductase (NAD(P)H) [Firmicutes bacterium ADurb.Bin419]
MDCIVDIKKEGIKVVASLPFDPRAEFNIPKGAIYVKCVIDNFQFKSKLMSRGSGRYCIFFNKQLLKDIGIDENEKLNVPLKIEPDMPTTLPTSIEMPELINNEVLTAISQRASIRKYIEKDIDPVQINTILNAGLCAPSATNKRPFHFVVVKDKEKMLSIIGNNTYVKMLQCAQACIIVCGDKVVQGIPEWLLADCSAATQNILLAIHSIGLGGVWCGIKQGSDFYKGIVKEFGLPKNIRPVSLVAFGYPSEEKAQACRFENSKIHFETW